MHIICTIAIVVVGVAVMAMIATWGVPTVQAVKANQWCYGDISDPHCYGNKQDCKSAAASQVTKEKCVSGDKFFP